MRYSTRKCLADFRMRKLKKIFYQIRINSIRLLTGKLFFIHSSNENNEELGTCRKKCDRLCIYIKIKWMKYDCLTFQTSRKIDSLFFFLLMVKNVVQFSNKLLLVVLKFKNLGLEITSYMSHEFNLGCCPPRIFS